MTHKRHDAYKAALAVVACLRDAGHTALFAGGCVRDRILGAEPKDYDIATDAEPERVAELFPRARKVGAAFGVVLVRRYGHDVEVATFRSDGAYIDGRHPVSVTFGNEVEDANRRDFTINGLFYDPVDGRTIDHVGGLADLESRVLRAIGNPTIRFAEDHLRMLRAIRFASRLGFTIEQSTLEAIRHEANSLSRISAERIWCELERILIHRSRAAAWALLSETGLSNFLSDVWQPTGGEAALISRRLTALPDVVDHVALPLAALLCDRAPNELAEIGRSLRLPNRLTKTVAWLVAALPQLRDDKTLDLASLKLLMASEHWHHALALLKTDLHACGHNATPLERLQERSAAIARRSIAPAPLLNGNELRRLGVSNGPVIGTILDTVYRAQLNETISTKEEAETLARRLISST